MVKHSSADIKGDNIPEAGIPESFKVLLKELQSLGLDVRVLRDDNTEVQIMESVDYTDTDFKFLNEDRNFGRGEEDFSAHGYQQQEFDDESGELVNSDFDDDYSDDFEESADFEESFDE